MSNRLAFQSHIEKRWYGRPGWLLLLSPLEWLFHAISKKRKATLQKRSTTFPVPVVVVGNISVGGTGKTPTLIALVKFLQEKGHKPGVVTRGYGRDRDSLSIARYAKSVAEIGDEPSLIFNATKCDVAVGRDRVEAIRILSEKFGCDVILADDGLQHYNMARDKEIIVIDGQRMLGNGHLLPVGPLRELPDRLDEADWVLVNTPSGGAEPALNEKAFFEIHVMPTCVKHIKSGDIFALDQLKEFDQVVAMAGLGNPQKFFNTLDSLDIRYEKRIFEDHHEYVSDDIETDPTKTLLMTEKDAVKCQHLVSDNAFALAIEMSLPNHFLEEFYLSIHQLIKTKSS